MKKFLYAVMAFLLMILAACSSTDSKIDRLETLVNEYIELQAEVMKGDKDAAEKVRKIDKEIEAGTDDLDKVELTEQQTERVQMIMVHAVGKAAKLGLNPFE